MKSIGQEDPKLQSDLDQKLHDIQLKGKELAAQELAKATNLPFIDLAHFPVNTAVLNMLDEGVARSGQLAIIAQDSRTLKIAIRDPRNEETKKILTDLLDRKFSLDLFVASPEGLESVWKRYQHSRRIKVSPLGVVDISEERIAELKEKIGGLEDLKKQLRELKTTEALDLIIAGALKISASDIHLEPEEAIIRVRYRLDGILSNIGDLPTREYARILSRIKIISGLKINIHNTPQDGRFTIRLDSRDVEVRVSILPGAFGENVVMRILDPLTTTQKLSSLGMRPDLLAILEAELKKTSGAILTTGPTGSGKTTSLYSFVRYLNREGIKIITIEDPIEYQITGISQTQVDEHQGYTFASGLRSIVRQDPDVILVGEIRDGETAEIAIQAGLTGHLVFSTLHTNDAAGTIPRLIDLGARPVNIGPALNVAMAQRLVRKLCSCKEETPLPALETEKIKKAFEQLSPAVQLPVISPEITIFKAKGCPKCNQGGYVGRIGIFELFLVSTDMERLITTSPSIPQVRDLALKEGMVPMLQDGYLKVLEGATTLEEIYRVVS